MLFDNYMISTRHLLFGMLLTHIFKHFQVSFSEETSLPHAVSTDHTLLKRMHVATCASHAHEQPALPAPQCDLDSSFASSDPYVAMSNQISSISLDQTVTNSHLERSLSNKDDLHATQMEI